MEDQLFLVLTQTTFYYLVIDINIHYTIRNIIKYIIMLEIDFSYLPFIKLAFVLIRKYHKSELNSSDDFIHFGFFTLK